MNQPDNHVTSEGHVISPLSLFNLFLVKFSISWSNMIPSEDEDSDVAVGDNDHVGKVEEAKHQSCKVLALSCITRLRLHFAR